MYRSAFGGLWTDRIDAAAIAADKLRHASITREEHDDLTFWVENGYLIKPQAVGPSVLDEVEADIQSAVRSGSRHVTFWDENGRHEKPATVEDLLKTEAKVLDVHWPLGSVQRAIFAGGLSRFLEMVFEMPAVAFQTLYFECGSEQGLHQDSAFVYVDQPLAFVASWLALEDVRPGAGELIYYPRSHRLPDKIFSGGTKALSADDTETGGYSSDLQRRCASAGLSDRRFLPRRGDVLFWAADLAHGGAPRIGSATRRSLVTHYCPRNRQPRYALHRAVKTIVLEGGHSVMSAT